MRKVSEFVASFRSMSAGHVIRAQLLTKKVAKVSIRNGFLSRREITHIFRSLICMDVRRGGNE